jgi:hypothetical protein
MSTQYRLVQSGKTASGGCSAGQGSSEPVAPRIIIIIIIIILFKVVDHFKIYEHTKAHGPTLIAPSFAST